MAISKRVYRVTPRNVCLLLVVILIISSVLTTTLFFDSISRYYYRFIPQFTSTTLSPKPTTTTMARTWPLQDWVERSNISHLFDWTWHKTGDFVKCSTPPSHTPKLAPRKLTSSRVVHNELAYFRSHPDEGCIVDDVARLPNVIPHPVPRARFWPATCAALNIDRSWVLCHQPQSKLGHLLPTTTRFVVTAFFNAYVDKGHCSRDVPGTVFTERATFHPQGWVNAPCTIDAITRLPSIKVKNRHRELVDSIGVYLSAPGHFGPQQLPRLLRLLAVAPTTTKVLVAKGGVADLLMDVLVERGVVARDRLVPFERTKQSDHFANVVYRSEAWPFMWNHTYPNSLHDRTDMQLVHRVFTADDQQLPEKKDRVILIKRKEGHARSLIEHSDVATIITSVLSKANMSSDLHLEIFTAQGHVREHIALFRRARVIVGPHGAGMMNVLWAPPGTHVVEIGYSTGMTFPQMYAEMSLHLDHKYWVCIGRGDYGTPIHVDMTDFIYIFNQIVQEIKTENDRS